MSKTRWGILPIVLCCTTFTVGLQSSRQPTRGQADSNTTKKAAANKSAPLSNKAPKTTGTTGTPMLPVPAVATQTPECFSVDDEVTPPLVVGCIESGQKTKYPLTITMNSTVERGDGVTIPIAGFAHWASDSKNNPLSLRLFLAGHLIPNPGPSLIQVQQGYVNFVLPTLSTDTEEKKAWTQILSEARRHPENKIPISVGLLSEKQPFASTQFITLRVFPWYTWLVEAGLVILLIALVALGWWSDLLRDNSGGRPQEPAKAPFSLGRMQMAWWFYLVVASYIYIWLITREINGLSATVLGLIGISAATGLAAIFVDQQKLSDDANTKLSLESEQAVVQARIQELTQGNPASGSPQAAELQAKKTRLGEITQLLSRYPAIRPVPVSHGLIDLLRDADGMSFHRFQIAVWTIVLGLVFVRNVSRDLIMPDFDTTLLGLMGISSGTYIGFKFPEKQK